MTLSAGGNNMTWRVPWGTETARKKSDITQSHVWPLYQLQPWLAHTVLVCSSTNDILRETKFLGESLLHVVFATCAVLLLVAKTSLGSILPREPTAECLQQQPEVSLHEHLCPPHERQRCAGIQAYDLGRFFILQHCKWCLRRMISCHFCNKAKLPLWCTGFPPGSMHVSRLKLWPCCKLVDTEVCTFTHVASLPWVSLTPIQTLFKREYKGKWMQKALLREQSNAYTFMPLNGPPERKRSNSAVPTGSAKWLSSSSHMSCASSQCWSFRSGCPSG